MEVTPVGYFFDTNVVSAAVSRELTGSSSSIHARIDAILDEQPLMLARVTQFELLRGIELLQLRGEGARKAAVVRQVLGAAVIAGLDDRGGFGWKMAAQLWAQMTERGLTLGEADLLIAVTAMVHGCRLLTADARLAERMAQLGHGESIELIATG